MQIVQVDFDSVKYEFDGYDLQSVLLNCINQLAPSRRPELDDDVTVVSEIIRVNRRSDTLRVIAPALRKYQYKFISEASLVSLTNEIIGRKRR